MLPTARARATGATYHVDFAEGSDERDGLSKQTAWKHAPGALAAESKVKAVVLSPGDTVLFKAGVVYRGSVEIPASGKEGAPIVYKGSGWGEGKAVIDGSVTIETPWTRCSSADELRGNKNYEKIYWTAAPKGFEFLAGTYEGNEFIYPCQDPPPLDPFHFERTDQLRVLPLNSPGTRQTDSSLADDRHLTQTDPASYDGASVLIWHQPNVTRVYSISGFDPTTHTIHHGKVGGAGLYRDRDTYYAILNHPAHLSGPGQYWHDRHTGRLYVWPRKGTSPFGNEYSVATTGDGIKASGKNHLVIEGFIIQKSCFGIRAIDEGASDVEIRGNEIRKLKASEKYAIHVDGENMRVIDNLVTDCQRAVGILAGGKNIVVEGNWVQRTSRQGIWFMGAQQSRIVGNTIIDVQGTHANGISVYMKCSGVLVRGNRVFNSNIAFTSQDSNGVTVEGNLFCSEASYAFADWGKCNNLRIERNTILRTDDLTSLVTGPATTAEVSHNILSSNHEGRGKDKNSNLRVTSADWGATFVDPANRDFRVKAGSKAFDAGNTRVPAAGLALPK
jgi:hypothetical protein